jgi:hypothetical protein
MPHLGYEAPAHTAERGCPWVPSFSPWYSRQLKAAAAIGDFLQWCMKVKSGGKPPAESGPTHVTPKRKTRR